MFLNFFHELRAAKVPVSLKEYLTLLEAMDRGAISNRVDEFYYLARSSLVKDEKHLDRFDKVFGHVFKGMEALDLGIDAQALPEEWLRKLTEKFLTEDEKKLIEAMGGWDKLMEALRQRLAEQKERHQGGNKWIGTGGTSPFGAHGYNPEGVRIGQNESRHQRAVKVWDKREFKNLDDTVEIGTRNLKVALRRLRKWAREGAEDELDLDGTIRKSAREGYIDVVMRPERRNAVKVLMFLDVGGSMDPHVKVCEELFSAARSEFKHLEFYYFHNCLYESVWKDNYRRNANKIPTFDVLNRFPADYKVVVVGDASMSPYEITYPGGSVEHWNEEPGAVWLQRLVDAWPNLAWINPTHSSAWEYSGSTQLIQEIIGRHRMFPLTVNGVEEATRSLGR